MSKDKVREFWIDDDGMALNNVPLHSEYIHVIDYAACAALEAKLAECVAENERLKQELKMINEWAVKANLDDAFKAYHSLKETLAKVKK